MIFKRCVGLILLLSSHAAMSQPSARLDPEGVKVYHGVGQSNNGVSEYISAMGDSTIMPIVDNFYYSIPGPRGDKFDQLRQQLAAEAAIGRIPHLSISLDDGRLWTDSVVATSTKFDYIIDSIATAVRDFGRKLFVRPGFEFGGSWFPYHPYLYPIAFQKIVNRMRAIANPDSMAFLWCYYPAAPDDFDSVDVRGPRWYPGDTIVDWFSLDLFGAADFHKDSASARRGKLTNKGKSERFLAVAAAKHKPVFLSETSATYTNITTDETDGESDWKAWFVPFFEFITDHPQIKGFNYTNWDWSQYTQYKAWGDSRIQVNSYILNNYRQEMRDPKYIHLRTAARQNVNGTISLPTSTKITNSPNPFATATAITYFVQHAGQIVVMISDIYGRTITLLDNTYRDVGTYTMPFDGSQLPSGSYYCRIVTIDGVSGGRFEIMR